MVDEIEVRESAPGDTASIVTLYRDAFPEEDLVPVVRALLLEDRHVVSLVATSDDSVVGHICFTLCTIEGRDERIALLAPLAVSSVRQGQGIGSELVQTGLQYMQAQGVALICVLGDPDYYSRFGFETEIDVLPPYPLPEVWRGAWQSIGLAETDASLAGMLSVIPPWREPALWGP